MSPLLKKLTFILCVKPNQIKNYIATFSLQPRDRFYGGNQVNAKIYWKFGNFFFGNKKQCTSRKLRDNKKQENIKSKFILCYGDGN